jgi:hypothetical protein
LFYLAPKFKHQTHTMDKKRIQRLCEEFLRDEDKLTPAFAVGVARASFRLILEELQNAEA